LREFGARCDNALPAAIFAGLELLALFSTDEAAFAARTLVLRWTAMGILLFVCRNPPGGLRFLSLRNALDTSIIAHVGELCKCNLCPKLLHVCPGLVIINEGRNHAEKKHFEPN
jgi:hypothetical protein